MGETVRKTIDIIDMYSYDSGYSTGYAEGEENGYKLGYSECLLRQKRKHKKFAEGKRRSIFVRMKMIGVFLLLATILAAWGTENGILAALFTIPVSLILIFLRDICEGR